jgi:hypothetical protein
MVVKNHRSTLEEEKKHIFTCEILNWDSGTGFVEDRFIQIDSDTQETD